MDLSPSAKTAYPTWWQLAAYAAAAKDQAGKYSYQVTDLSSALTEIGLLEGKTVGFTERAGAASLFGIARGMERAADVLTAAARIDELTAAMVSDVPWSRPLTVQTAAPRWQLKAEITYRAPDGTVVTTWGTGVFAGVLPTNVGALRDEAWLQFSRLLSQRSEQRNTGGELLDIGRQYLMAI